MTLSHYANFLIQIFWCIIQNAPVIDHSLKSYYTANHRFIRLAGEEPNILPHQVFGHALPKHTVYLDRRIISFGKLFRFDILAVSRSVRLVLFNLLTESPWTCPVCYIYGMDFPFGRTQDLVSALPCWCVANDQSKHGNVTYRFHVQSGNNGNVDGCWWTYYRARDGQQRYFFLISVLDHAVDCRIFLVTAYINLITSPYKKSGKVFLTLLWNFQWPYDVVNFSERMRGEESALTYSQQAADLK